MRHWTALLLCAVAGTAVAAEIKVLSAGAIEPGLRAAAAAFRKQSGHEVNIAFNTTPEIRKRIGGGAGHLKQRSAQALGAAGRIDRVQPRLQRHLLREPAQENGDL